MGLEVVIGRRTERKEGNNEGRRALTTYRVSYLLLRYICRCLLVFFLCLALRFASFSPPCCDGSVVKRTSRGARLPTAHATYGVILSVTCLEASMLPFFPSSEKRHHSCFGMCFLYVPASPNASVRSRKLILPSFPFMSCLLRGTIVNGTYGMHKNLPGMYLTMFTNNIWSYLLWSPVIVSKHRCQIPPPRFLSVCLSNFLPLCSAFLCLLYFFASLVSLPLYLSTSPPLWFSTFLRVLSSRRVGRGPHVGLVPAAAGP